MPQNTILYIISHEEIDLFAKSWALQLGLGMGKHILYPLTKRKWLGTQKQWLRPDMNEEMLTWMLNINTNKVTTCLRSR